MDAEIQLIVGLGNPGEMYTGTRHNIGEYFVRGLARVLDETLELESRFHGEVGNAVLGGHRLVLMVPNTYMNESGKAVAALANYYKIHAAQILVAHDELDLPPGSARFKVGGGHGGHNGLRDIITGLGKQRGFRRLRIGIGHPGLVERVNDYVLARASEADCNATTAAMNEAIHALPFVLAGDMTKAMTQLHSFNYAPPAK